MDITARTESGRSAGLTARHVLIVVSGCMLTFGCSALTFSTWGLFQPVVSEELGISQARSAVYVTVMYLTMTACSPFAGRLLQRADPRWVITAACLLDAAGFTVMSLARAAWMLYAAGVVMGAGMIFVLWLAVPTLINRWFVRGAGLLIGICMAFTGVGGAVWSSLFTMLKTSGMGSGGIYRIWAVIAVVTSLPFTLLVLRGHPGEVGLAPYGAREDAGGQVAPPLGLSSARAMHAPAFYVLCLGAGVINIAVLIAMQFPAYARSLTDVPWDKVVVGGVMSTLMMVGQAIGKVTIGFAADRSPRGALLFAVTCGAAGILLCWLGAASLPLLYTGAFVFGFFYATAVVLVPTLARLAFGVREYPVIYSRVSTVFNLIAAFASIIWALIGSAFGFSAVFVVGLVLIVVVLVACSHVVGSAAALRTEWTE